MNITSPTNRKFPFEFLQKVGNYIIGISILCYISGFVITNLYLGSLGIVNIEILKSRYILSGFLFLVFVGSIAYLLYGLLQTLNKFRQVTAMNIIFKILWYSFSSISVIIFVIVLLSALAGSVKNPPIGLPQLSPTISWSEWLKTAPATIFQKLLILIGFSSIFIVIVSIAVSVTNHKKIDIPKLPWNHLTLNLIKEILSIIKKNIGRILGLFVFFLLLSIFDSAIKFIKTNGTTHLSESVKSLSPGEWGGFIGAIILIYAFLSIIIIWTFFTMTSLSTKPNEDIPLTRTSGFIVAVVVVMLLVIPTYALGVYPTIPQQIGGGQIAKVEAYTSNDDINRDFSNTGVEIYLIDRTSSSTIFFLVDNQNNEHKIMEINNDHILSIIYNPKSLNSTISPPTPTVEYTPSKTPMQITTGTQVVPVTTSTP